MNLDSESIPEMDAKNDSSKIVSTGTGTDTATNVQETKLNVSNESPNEAVGITEEVKETQQHSTEAEDPPLNEDFSQDFEKTDDHDLQELKCVVAQLDHPSCDPACTQERFEACMVLAGVGDAIGYKNGDWEFCSSGEVIHAELAALGGIKNIDVTSEQWMVSDDTVMHIATAEALVSVPDFVSLDAIYVTLAKHYQECMKQMAGRAPGLTCSSLIPMLKPDVPQGIHLPFNPRGGGCGAAMRAAPIGLLFFRPEDISLLVAVSIESGRMSHNHPTGYLGSLATSLFVSYAIQGKPLKEWGRGLLDTLEEHAWKYIKETGRDLKDNQANWNYFTDQWMNYLKYRGIYDGQSEPNFPTEYGVNERDNFYYSLSFDGTGGASGHDAPMIAYDALLSCGDSWSELCSRSMLHGGDSDSTGIIAAACWGGMHGYKEVPEGNYQNLEFLEKLQYLSKKLYERSHTCP